MLCIFSPSFSCTKFSHSSLIIIYSIYTIFYFRSYIPPPRTTSSLSISLYLSLSSIPPPPPPVSQQSPQQPLTLNVKVSEDMLRLVVEEAQRSSTGIDTGEGRMIKAVLDMQDTEVETSRSYTLYFALVSFFLAHVRTFKLFPSLPLLFYASLFLFLLHPLHFLSPLPLFILRFVV